MPPHEGRFVPALRLSVVWTPSFSAYSIGIAGLDSFRSGTVAERASFRAPKAPWSLCIGPACPARAGAASDAGGQVASPAAGSTRFINGLGPAAAQALALFSSPVASKEHPVALRVSPIFALSGGGLEMRCAWW